MKTFCQYIEPQRIIRELIRFRADEAGRRHPAQRLSSISPLAPDPMTAVAPVFTALFPSRRTWLRLPRKLRLQTPRQHLLRRELSATVFADLKARPDSTTPWRKALSAMVESIQAQAASPCPEFTTPERFTIRKDSGKLRTIHAYRDPAQRTLLTLLHRYLSDQIDPTFSPASFAFRKDPAHGRNSAVELLQAYRQRHAETGVFVAECDLTDFFDHIPHAAIRSALAAHALDPQALRLVEAYLTSGASDRERGIPQGGALSPLLANLVLAVVDRAVADRHGASGTYYARFCDDILVAHPQAQECQRTLDTCLDAIASLGLPFHTPAAIGTYGRGFYAIKSKLPYRWDDPAQHEGTAPWVSFLGYQIRHDGRIRVRGSSLRKQIEKQHQTVETVRLLVHSTPVEDLRASGSQILERTAEQLVAMSVGRIRNRVSGTPQPCWADAFPLLDANPSASHQCKALDRCRERQLSRLKRTLIGHGCLDEDDSASAQHQASLEILAAAFEIAPADLPRLELQKPLYRGAPFSYYAALTQDSPLPYTGYSP